MARVDLRYLCRDQDKRGNLRIYYRYPGAKKVRLRSPEGTPEFLSEYLDAQSTAPGKLNAERELKRGSVGWVVNRYYQSAKFKQLNARTKLVRERRLADFVEKYSDKDIRSLRPKHVRLMIDRLADRPGAANELLKFLRQVLNQAVHDEMIPSNPALAVSYLPTSPSGFRVWTMEEIDQFREFYPDGTKQRLAFELLFGLGLRRADIVEIGPQHVKNGILRKTLKKGRDKHPRKVSIPVSEYLQHLIKITPCGDMTFLVNEIGKSFTPEGFSNTFVKWTRKAGLPKGLSPHGLRKACATELAHQRATNKELQAYFGWSTLKEPERYTQSADQELLSAGVSAKAELLAPKGWGRK